MTSEMYLCSLTDPAPQKAEVTITGWTASQDLRVPHVDIAFSDKNYNRMTITMNDAQAVNLYMALGAYLQEQDEDPPHPLPERMVRRARVQVDL